MTTSLMQASATGLPAIATWHSGFSDQIIDGKNGFLVGEGNYEALAEKIIYLINHPEIWPGFGRFGREHVRQNYDQAALIKKQIEIYREIID
jgi:colanic acid/amylovoran biosynthesis glycosyltransferase